MLERTFHDNWDEFGTKMAKKDHLLPKSGISDVKGLNLNLFVNWLQGHLGLLLKMFAAYASGYTKRQVFKIIIL